MTSLEAAPPPPLGKTLAARLLCACVWPGGPDSLKPDPRFRDLAGYRSEPSLVQGVTWRDSAAAIAPTEDGLVVAFHGRPLPGRPSALTDWLATLLAEPVRARDLPGRVQGGFLAMLEALWPQLEARLAVLGRGQRGEGPLYLAGHGAGGALALLAASRLLAERRPVAGVATFGAPRCGDAAFVAACEETFELACFETYLDLVPFLAPGPSLIRLSAALPSLGPLFRRAEQWGYAAPRSRRVIGAPGQVTPASSLLDDARLAEILGRYMEGRVDSLLAAHSLLGAGGYVEGFCQEQA